MLQFLNFKYKLMTSDELFRALERLTRPIHPDIKFGRAIETVFVNNVLSPKYNLKKIQDIDIELKTTLFEKIWNDSVEYLCKKNNLNFVADYTLNCILFEEDKRTFFVEDNHPYFRMNINISSLLQLPCPLKNSPLNLSRLEIYSSTMDSKKLRQEKSLHFPIEKFLIVEGITEEILLPSFADILGYNFDKNGVHLISAGGKNQIARWYIQNKDIIRLPIFILLDADAIEVQQLLLPQLKQKDKIYLIKSGEFEDIIPEKAIKKTINETFKNEFNIVMADIRSNEPMCKVLQELMRTHGVGDFKKADFAKRVNEILQRNKWVSEEIENIIYKIKEI